MHGLILRAIQCFLRDIWGAAFWAALVQDLRLPTAGFEAMLTYDPHLAGQIIDAAALRLKRHRDGLLEDLGTYLVSHPRREPIRRLLRFGGAGFADFLHSVEDLPDRLRLAVPDLRLPVLALRQVDADRFTLTVGASLDGVSPADAAQVLLGLVRAIADDYGTLVLIEPTGGGTLAIDLLDGAHACARDFRLAAGA